MRHEVGTERPQFSILLRVHCSRKMSPLQNKNEPISQGRSQKKITTAPARLMKINMSKAFSMVKFSSEEFLGCL